MKTIPSLREQRLPPGQDADFLREVARKKIEAFASDHWTDYNAHDPGITLLEMLVYAITDLSMRTHVDVHRLLEHADVSSFFPPEEVLSNAVFTLEDHERLLKARPEVRNVWIEALEAPSGHEGLALEDQYLLLVDLMPVQHQVEDADESLMMDFNEHWVTGDPIEVNDQTYSFFILFPAWEELDASGSYMTGEADLVEVNSFVIEGEKRFVEDIDRYVIEAYRLDCTLQFQRSDESTLSLAQTFPINLSTGIPSTAFGETEEERLFAQNLEAQLDEQLLLFLKTYQQKARLRARFVENLRAFLRPFRNLCEDLVDIRTINIQQIGVQIDQLELVPDVNPADVLGHLYCELEQFIDEQATQNQGRQPIDKIYTSDLVNLIMRQAGVMGVGELRLDLFVDRKKLEAQSGAENVLVLQDPHVYKPKFSAFDSHIAVVIRGVRQEVSEVEVRRCFEHAKNETIAGSDETRQALTASKPPPSIKVEQYYSIQNEFPRAYGLRTGEIPATASSLRKAQVQQLKGFLLLLEQVLANYCSQLAHFPRLFSLKESEEQTYFYQPLYEVPAVRSLFKAFMDQGDGSEESWEAFKAGGNAHTRALAEAVESRSTFWHRRNQFIDHLLARFGESLMEYHAWTLRQNKGQLTADLVWDKLSFLKRQPALIANRALAFNYAATKEGQPDVWDTENVSGVEKRIAGMLGIPDFRRRDLSLVPVPERVRPFGVPLEQHQPLSPLVEHLLRHLDFYQTDANSPSEARLRIRMQAGSPSTAPSGGVLLSHPRGKGHYVLQPGLEEEVFTLIQRAQRYDAYQLSLRANGQTFRVDLMEEDATAMLASRESSFPSKMEAEKAIWELQRFAQGRAMEGMHLIEHHLLKPVSGNHEALRPITFEENRNQAFIEGDEVYLFQVSIFLPGWAGRFQDASFRALVEQTLREELPAYIFPWIYWVNPVLSENMRVAGNPITEDVYTSPEEFNTFEITYKSWLEALHAYETTRNDTTLSQLIAMREAFVAAMNALIALRNVPNGNGGTMVELTNHYKDPNPRDAD